MKGCKNLIVAEKKTLLKRGNVIAVMTANGESLPLAVTTGNVIGDIVKNYVPD